MGRLKRGQEPAGRPVLQRGRGAGVGGACGTSAWSGRGGAGGTRVGPWAEVGQPTLRGLAVELLGLRGGWRCAQACAVGGALWPSSWPQSSWSGPVFLKIFNVWPTMSEVQSGPITHSHKD